MIAIDNGVDWWGGGGGSYPSVTLPITTPATPSTPVSAPTTPAAGAAMTGTNRNAMSLFDVFGNIQNQTQYTNASKSSPLYNVTMPTLNYSGGGGYTPNYLGTRDDLLNPVSGTTQVSRSLQEFLNPNSDYMRNAAQRGVEMAATRGGVNSSIAAGSAQRAALESVQPFVQQAVDVDQQKYQLMAQDYLAQQGYQAQSLLADKNNALQAALAQYQGGLQMSLAQQQANTENWLSQQNFGRALFGQTFSNSMGMLNMVQQYGLEDPELYTPEVLSGYTNFFQQNMNDLLARYFGK